MAEMWRDTLYLWKGTVNIEKEDESKEAVISWSGTRINCPECPDSRSAAMPTKRAFSSSSVTFDFKGTVEQPVSKATIVSLTGGTWEHAGEGGDNKASNDDRRLPAADLTHKLDLSRWLKDPRPFQRSLVLGSGHNEYGHFIELGWIGHGGIFRMNLLDDDGKREGTLTLARRYLPNGDERSTWSFTRMFSEMQLGVPPLLNEDVWSHVADFLGPSRYFVQEHVTPWQEHAILHSERYMTKRSNKGALLKIKKGSAGLLGIASPLKMPTPDGKPFQLRFVTLEGSGDPEPNTTWMKQCWGCGGSEVKKILEFDCRWTVLQSDFDDDVPLAVPYPWIKGEFCSEQCILCSVPQIAQVCTEWTQSAAKEAVDTDVHADPVWLETMDGGSSFWKCVEQDKEALGMMTKAGWKQSAHAHEGWVLKLPMELN